MNKKHIQRMQIEALQAQLKISERKEQDSIAAAQILASKMRQYQQQCQQLDDKLNTQIAVNQQLLDHIQF